MILQTEKDSLDYVKYCPECGCTWSFICEDIIRGQFVECESCGHPQDLEPCIVTP